MNRPLTPHGPGFRFLDTFECLENKGIGIWHLDPNLWFFKDHFPSNPIAPAALLMEFAAQTAGALWMQGCGKPDTALFVASIDAMRIQSAALPGETLTTTATLVRELGPLAQFEFEIANGPRAVAKGRITLSRQLARSKLG
jgi:3-hydroxymyristoyl/3-hydroxydecanoyl-(acyl carrier protein) dehydratase